MVDILQLSRLSFILTRKLKALKTNLKKWHEEVFGNIEKMKKGSFG
jgi:hypothetical protein